MDKNADLLITIRDNINVVLQTLIAKHDFSGETLPGITTSDFETLKDAEQITRDLMHTVDPSTK